MPDHFEAAALPAGICAGARVASLAVDGAWGAAAAEAFFVYGVNVDIPRRGELYTVRAIHSLHHEGVVWPFVELAEMPPGPVYLAAWFSAAPRPPRLARALRAARDAADRWLLRIAFGIGAGLPDFGARPRAGRSRWMNF